MKKVIILSSLAVSAILWSCGGNEKKSEAQPSAESANTATAEAPKTADAAPAYDPKRGEGKWSAENVVIDEKLNAEWATSGEGIAKTKCASCHKLTDEKLVGPGWKGVTSRRMAPWIMNFITNPDPMLDKDPQAQAMLELCLVRMPNQNLSDGEARNILEYMRRNDGVK